MTVRWLASQLNLSISQLERGFTRHVGVGPKLLARQTRVCALAAEAIPQAVLEGAQALLGQLSLAVGDDDDGRARSRRR